MTQHEGPGDSDRPGLDPLNVHWFSVRLDQTNPVSAWCDLRECFIENGMHLRGHWGDVGMWTADTTVPLDFKRAVHTVVTQAKTAEEKRDIMLSVIRGEWKPK